MHKQSNSILPCRKADLYSALAKPTSDNRVKKVSCDVSKVEVFETVEVEITKFKTDYDPLDGRINWRIVASDGTELSLTSDSPTLDFYASVEFCYQTVRIYPFIYHADPNLFVELNVENNLTIQPRSAWGARPPVTNRPDLSYDPVKPDDYDSIVIHHSGNRHDFPTMKMIQDKHMNASGDDQRADIGYHFGIDKDGIIYEGRAIDILGAHIKLYNAGKIGVLFLSDLSTDNEGLEYYKKLVEWSDGELTKAMEKSLLKLCVQLDHLYGIDKVGGHREFAAARLRGLKKEADQLRKEAREKEALGLKQEAAELLQQAREKEKDSGEKSEDRFCPGNLAMAEMEKWRTQLKKLKP